MLDILQEVGLTFIPLFVAMDAVGTLPILLGITQDVEAKERSKMLRLALLTALILGLVFLAIGKGVLLVLGITVADFLVAGGLILFILAAKELATGKMIEVSPKEGMLAIVPIGTPLVAGPAVLTTLLILIDQFSIIIVLASFLLNLVVAWIVFAQANRLASLLGVGGLKGVSKVASLLLAAIAIMMIRRGVFQILGWG